MKNIMMVALATTMLSAPAFAQNSTMPSGKSDTTSNGGMKSSDGGMKSGNMKAGGGTMMKKNMKSGGMMQNGATNGTSTLAGPAGKMQNPANN